MAPDWTGEIPAVVYFMVGTGGGPYVLLAIFATRL